MRSYENLLKISSSRLTVHWDGKLLENISGNVTADRLPILVSNIGENQLLGVYKITKERG